MYYKEFFLKLISTIKENSIFCISVTGAFILHLVVAWQPLNRLEGFYLPHFVGPLMDDSYIVFGISRDLADWFSGCLPSFQLTSGFQPLIALLFSPFFHFFPDQKELPIHLALSLNAFLGFLANISLYNLLRKIVNRSIATFLVSLWIWSPYVMNQSVNGMETTLALLLLLITFNYYWRINEGSLDKPRFWFFLGLFLGLGFWARVDFGMLGVAVFIDQAWLAIRDDKHLRFLRLRNILLCCFSALVIASPWIVFTIVNTGSIMPVSGKAVYQVTNVVFNHLLNQDLSSFPIMMFKYFKEDFLIYQPLVALSKNSIWQLFIVLLSLIGFIFALRDSKLRVLFRSVWFFQALLVMSYIFIIGGFWHLNRYLYPVYTLILLLHASTLRYLESRIKLKSWVLALLLVIK
jgi:hypothetical protein